ncbi:MAG TPA: glycosyltransferase family 1 protein [Acidimicrobiales bacterium]|nr:glycosyltransferase family 1 protein [Acidimicrobiales bacterium]
MTSRTGVGTTGTSRSPTDLPLRVLMLVEQLRRKAAGGIGTYVSGLIQGLTELPDQARPDIELLASRPREKPDRLAMLGFPLRSSVLPGPVLTRAWDRGLLRAPGSFDVVHALSMATVEPGAAALVSTVHDLLWRHVPDTYPARGRAWHEAALQRSLARSDRFIVPSEVVAADLVGAGASPDRVTVVPMGCDHLPAPDSTAVDALLSRLGVAGPFLLSVGTMEPRKNLTRLALAYDRMRASLPEPWPLVVVGPSGWGEQLHEHQGVVLAGMVTPPELAALYARARLLAYVPLMEGFGLPPVEAMLAGAPVVASDVPSTGSAAYQVDPNDTDSIAEGLLVVATDEAVRHRLQAAGRSHAAQLGWSSIARRHVALWEEVRADG